jgi:hypothetical protein
MIRELRSWLRDQVVQDVPHTSAACEFGCQSVTCLRGEWEHCARRFTYCYCALARGLRPWASEPRVGEARRGDRGWV